MEELFCCPNPACTLPGQPLPYVIAQALEFLCPQCKAVLVPKTEDNWSQQISSDASYWVLDKLEHTPGMILSEVIRLRSLFAEGQTYGTILQIRDIFEVCLKLPTLIAASKVYASKDTTEAERGFLSALVAKPLSLGDWRSIAGKALPPTVRIPSVLRQLLKATLSTFDRYDIPNWRNRTIGHGALGFDTDQEMRHDIEEKLQVIRDHLLQTDILYQQVGIYAKIGQTTVRLVDPFADLSTSTGNLMAECDRESWSVFPYLHLLDGRVFFFDAYYHERRRITALLNYSEGKRQFQILAQVVELYEQLVLATKLKLTEEPFDQTIHTRRDEELLADLRTSIDIVEPSEINTWLATALKSHPKGVFLIQMERGCGKTTFCRNIDPLGLARKKFPKVGLRVHYVNEVYGFRPGNFVWSVTDAFRSNDKGEIAIVGDIPTLSPVAADKQSALANHLAFFLEHRRRLFGEASLVLIIDAIDEAPFGDASILDFVPPPQLLVNGVFIVITSRTKPEIPARLSKALSALTFTAALTIARDHPSNTRLLQSFLTSSRTPQPLWQPFLDLAESRFLYLRTLVDALRLFNVRDYGDLPKGSALIGSLIDRLRRVYGQRHFEHLADILCILAHAFEPLSLEELCHLLAEPFPSLRTAAFLKDVQGLLRVDRADSGNLYSIGHDLTSRLLRERFTAVQKDTLKSWELLLAGLSEEETMQRSTWLDYLILHISDYRLRDGGAAVSPQSDLGYATVLLGYITSQGLDTSARTYRRERELVVTLFDSLSRIGDQKMYLAMARRVPRRMLPDALERRLQDGDTTLLKLAVSDEEIDGEDLLFLRALTIATFRTELFNQAIRLGDKIYSKTGAPEDLITLALILKGTDAEIDGSFTMSRCRKIARDVNKLQLSGSLTRSQRGFLLYSVGRIYGDTFEHLAESRPLLKESLSAFEQVGDRDSVLALKNALALSLFDEGAFLPAYEKLLEIASALETTGAHLRSLNEALSVNIYILSYLAHKPRAELVPFEELTSWELRAYQLNNSCLVSVTSGNMQSGRKFADECLALTESRRGVYSRAAILNNTSVLFGLSENLLLAHEICKQSGYSLGEAITGRNLGLEYPEVGGVLSWQGKMLWPCLKNIDVLPTG